MSISFLGHVSKDVNIVDGIRSIVAGGGVFYGSIAVARLGGKAKVYTKCAKEDRIIFSEMEKSGVGVHFFSSLSSTSIKNLYPTSNPDDRVSTIISLAEPFRKSEIDSVQDEILHVNPLWHGEFSEELIPLVRKKTSFLSGDAQGFLRNVRDKKMVYEDWSEKRDYLRYFDLFKVDVKEAKIISGKDDIKEGLKFIHNMGARIVIGTYSEGVYVYDGKKFYEAKFGKWKLEGRTGRGDTCTAAFIVALNEMNLSAATKFAADVTTRKMEYPGPLRR
jgi:sugar/nucleoside kinase (ribokinase family)